jgi:putative transposase
MQHRPIRRLLGAEIGFLAVLPTWGQNLHLHPHPHCVAPGVGISLDGLRWIGCKKSSFFLPVRLLGPEFRTLFLHSLRPFEKGALHFHGELKMVALNS